MRQLNSNGVPIDQTGIRDLAFSNWIRENLPNPKQGMTVTDLDFIFNDYKQKKILLAEIKTRNAPIKTHQRKTFEVLHKALLKGFKDEDYTYCGTHLIQFENTNPEDGEIYINGLLVTRFEFIAFLSFKDGLGFY